MVDQEFQRAAALQGSYEYEKEEGVDDYLRLLRVGLVFRKVTNVTIPKVTIEYNEETKRWAYAYHSTFHTYTIRFIPNQVQKIQDETFDCRPSESTFTFDEQNPNILVQHQACNDEEIPDVVTTFEKLDEKSLKITRVCGSHSCAQYFKKVSDVAGGDFVDGVGVPAGAADGVPVEEAHDSADQQPQPRDLQ